MKVLFLKIIHQAHLFFIISGLLLFGAFLSLGQKTLDIAIHDTYIVLDFKSIGTFIFLLFSMYAFFYFLLRKFTSKGMAWLHLILVLPLFIQLLMGRFLDYGSDSPRYLPNNSSDVFTKSLLPDETTMVVLAFIFGQLIFVIGLLVATYRYLKSR
ncbi:MAG: hypothetical protein IT236_07310 [Bacteroidia bacterium]|nr:hypothetical protein [Bacteroidia bacterium]